MVGKNDDGIGDKRPLGCDVSEGFFQALEIGGLGQYRLTIVCDEREEVASSLLIRAPEIAHLNVTRYPIDGGSASLDPPYILDADDTIC